jgi:CpeT protein
MHPQPLSEQLSTLCTWMAGEFTNQQQAIANPTQFAHIRIYFRPLPWTFFNTIGFYSEQVYDYDLWSPYRQGIHRLIEQNNSIYIENYGLQDPMRYAGAGRDLNILNSIPPDRIDRRPGCSMVFHRDPNPDREAPDRYIGSVEPGNQCRIPRDGRWTYLVSEVELTATTWVSRDRGFDPTSHDLIWGSDHGHLRFDKCRSYAEELPQP